MSINNKLVAQKCATKTPPFAKRLFELSLKGVVRSNDVFIFLGDNAWYRAKSYPQDTCWVTLIPNDGSKPDKHNWGFVKTLSVLIFDTSGVNYQLIEHLAYELLKAEATIVRAITFYGELAIFTQGVGYGK